MEYRPALPEHNDNISHDRPVREFLLLFSGVTGFLLAVFWVLGWSVDLAVDYISPEVEEAIFSHDFAWASGESAEREPKEAELQRLVDELRRCIQISYPLKVSLVDAEEANAMAFPGGRIVVLSGLLEKVQSENGLSFVLAHELAHFRNRDHLRGMGRGLVLTAVTAFLTGAGSDLTRMFSPATGLGLARYSQDRESLADATALRALACYYGHAGGATEFFAAMKPLEEGKGQAIGRYFSSHPEAVRRIDSLNRLARELDLREEQLVALPEVLVVPEPECKS
jgi:Zn-dependent protease with chaperone function